MKKSLKILFISESHFPNDIRVKKEAEKLIENSHKLYIIALKYPTQKFYEKDESLSIIRIPKLELFTISKQSSDEKKKQIVRKLQGIIGYFIEYFYFTLLSLIISLYLLAIKKIDVIHTHNPPDTLVLPAIIYRLFKKTYVYDQHDLSSDLYVEKFGAKPAMVYRSLKLFELFSFKMANKVIVTNNSYREIALKRYKIQNSKIAVVRNGPDLKDYQFRYAETDPKKNTIVCYLGAINFQDGVDNLVKIADLIVNKKKYREIFFLVVGDGDYLARVKDLTNKNNLEEFFNFTGYIYDRTKLNQLLSKADICVDTATYSFYNDNSTFIKNMEYMVFEKPVVSFALKESMYTLDNAAIYIEKDDLNKFAEAIISLARDKDFQLKIAKNGKKQLDKLNWNLVSKPLIETYQEIAKKLY